MTIGAIIAVALLGAGAVMALSRDDDNPGRGPNETLPPTTSSPSTTQTTTTETTPPRPAEFVEISSVELDGGQYRVNYEVSGFEPLRDGGPDSLHIHFFLDTTAPENAGRGPSAGDWDLTDDPESFLTKYTPETKGAATQMCSAVATVDHYLHRPDELTGNCVPLPD